MGVKTMKLNYIIAGKKPQILEANIISRDQVIITLDGKLFCDGPLLSNLLCTIIMSVHSHMIKRYKQKLIAANYNSSVCYNSKHGFLQYNYTETDITLKAISAKQAKLYAKANPKKSISVC